jgi:hypothetical protein
MNFCSNFEYDLRVGQVKEFELAKILENENIEVKRDLKAHLTGNIFVEYFSRGKKSGISNSKSNWYCFVISEYSFFFIKTEDLKIKCRMYLKTKRDVLGGDNNTSRGILLPISELIK